MEAELKKLTATLAAMTAKLGHDENRPPNSSNNSDGTKDGNNRRPQMKKLRNMGGYCHSHGFHPVGNGHSSTNCNWQKPGHNTAATWSNRMDGNTYWPLARRVAIEQQDHPAWKDKTAPTS